LKPAYTLPPIYNSVNQIDITSPIVIEYTGQATLLGYSLEPNSIIPGEELLITLFWQVTDGFAENHPLFVQLIDQNGDRVAGRDTHGGLGRYPTGAWQPGQIIADTIPLSIPQTDAGPTGLLLTMGFWNDDGTLLETGSSSGTNILGTVRLAANTPTVAEPALYQLGDQVALVELETPSKTAVPGQTIPLTLTWRALRQPDADYTIFMHLLDNTENLVQAYDQPPLNGAFPTHLWQPGDTVIDEWYIQLPAEMENGRYHLIVGWYKPDDLTRLPVTDADGSELSGGIIPLQTFQIEEGE
jgi:hypothetical protein